MLRPNKLNTHWSGNADRLGYGWSWPINHPRDRLTAYCAKISGSLWNPTRNGGPARIGISLLGTLFN